MSRPFPIIEEQEEEEEEEEQQQQQQNVVFDMQEDLVPQRRKNLPSIRRSIGWWPLPEVKLASWDPENEKQWNNGGRDVAHRNLIVSTINLFCGFGVWLVWPTITSKIQLAHDEDPTLYPFQDWGSPKGSDYNVLLYTLPAVAGLSGGTMRLANSFITQIIGGRNVAFHSSIMLTVAMIWTAVALSSKTPSFNSLLVGAWLSGTGGGAFASSMSNMSTLYPKAKQGYALGINGGLGNLGVGMSQLLVPIFMTLPFGKAVQGAADVWPEHAAWFWWPICVMSAIAAYLWMSNHPEHGNHAGASDNLWNVIHYYWFEGVGLAMGMIAIIILVRTRDKPFFVSSIGQIFYNLMLVVVAAILEHAALRFLSPPSSQPKLKEQYKVFNDKHTYIMTFLYTMGFGSFIGFSGAFPKLITDIFGYVTKAGCFYMNENTAEMNFVKGGTEFDCIANEGIWGSETITNPNAPDVFSYSWFGPVVGSLIRPIGGILADRHGGAKVTQVLIVWCTVATFTLGILIQKTAELQQPEKNFGLFVFLFVNVFFCVGAMNGTTFRTIGVLFDDKLAGSVLGWSSAIASYGAYVIPAMFGIAIDGGAPEITLYCLGVYYIFCGVLNYYYYEAPWSERKGV